MDNSKNRHNENLGVNKIGKSIRKSPLHQPNFGNNNAAKQQPQPQVYNISKNDFRDIVQQLTGSPSPSHSQDPPPRPPPHNPPKPQQSMRLQKIRPPPLAPINRPHMRPPIPVPAAPPLVPYNTTLPRPAQFGVGQPSPTPVPPLTPGELWANTTESPISAYMRYLQNSMMESPWGNQAQPQPQPLPPPHPQPLVPGNVQPHPPSSGLLPNPHMPMLPSPRLNGPIPSVNATNPTGPNIPSSQVNGPPILPSPTSQFLLPSPSGYMNFLSPPSPYPLLSPGIQFPSPFLPNFPFSPLAQSGILGPGPQPPSSPGLVFPLSPSGYFPIASPRWGDQ